MLIGFHFKGRPPAKLLWLIVLCAFVTQPLSVSADVQPAPSDDCVVCNGSATVLSTFPGENTYEWYNSNGALLNIDQNSFGQSALFNLCPGVYQVQWTNGTDNDAQFFVIDVPQQVVGQPGLLNICEDTIDEDLFSLIQGPTQAGGVWTNPIGQPHSGTFDSDQDVGGFYQYEVTFNGCSLFTGVFVNLIQNANPGLSATYLICETYDPFFLTTVLAGTPEPNGQWFNASQTPIDGFYYPDVDETELFTYMIDTVPGCPAVFSTLLVIENLLPDPGIDSEVAICPSALPFDPTDYLNGTPDAGGNWYDDQFNLMPLPFDPATIPAGTYQYTVAGATPCPSQEAFLTIGFTAGIDPGVGGDFAFCEDEGTINLNALLSGSPTTGGAWTDSNGDFVGNVVNAEPNTNEEYTYTVTAVGCQPVSSEVEVSFEALPDAGAGNLQTVCESAQSIDPSTLLDPLADGGGEWTLAGVPINGSLSLEADQTYNLTYTVTANLCPTDQATYTVNVDNEPEISGPATTDLCSDAGITSLESLVTVEAGFNAVWTTPDNLPFDGNFDPLLNQEGLYTISLESGNSCPDVSSGIQVTVVDPAFLDGAVVLEECVFNTSINLSELLPEDIDAGGAWFSAGQPTGDQVDGVESSSGIYTYELQGPDACGVATFEVDLTIVEPLTAGDGNSLAVCSTEGIIDLEDYLDNADQGGYWVFNGQEIGSGVLNPATDNGGAYSYVIPAFGPCPADSTEVLVDVQDGLAVSAGPDQTLCETDEGVTLGSNQCDGCTFEWTPVDPLDDPLIQQPVFTPFDVEVATTYTISVVASNGVCDAQDEVEVTILPAPNLEVQLLETLCAGDVFWAEADGAGDFQWFLDGEVVSDQSEFETLLFTNTEVTLIGTNTEGCEALWESQVTVHPLPQPFFDLPPVEGCLPVELSLEMPEHDSNENWWWEFNNQIITSPSYITSIENSGDYDLTLTAENEFGCIASMTQESWIQVYDYPTVTFRFPEELSFHQTEVAFENLSDANLHYQWDFAGLGESNEFEPIFVFPSDPHQGYLVCLTGTTVEGCSSVHCESVFFSGDLLVYVPNAFTPDGDGLNEVFRPFVSGFKEDTYSLQVFNRWGEVIFETTDVESFWRGNVKGSNYFAQDGVYTWKIEVEDAYSAERKRFTGHVTILR